MRKLFYLSIPFLILLLTIGCASIVGKEYNLEKRHPQTMPILKLKFLNDSSGVITKQEETLISKSFNFKRAKRNFLIITDIEEVKELEYLKKGDTIVSYKKELYFFKKDYKLVFKQVN